MAFERECTESYWEGHVRAFEFFGGVPNRISYDNSKVMVAKIIGAHDGELTDGFLKLQSHYLFKEHFCRVACANEKGVVEGVVKYSRSNFMVPVSDPLKSFGDHRDCPCCYPWSFHNSCRVPQVD
jgi:transposase